MMTEEKLSSTFPRESCLKINKKRQFLIDYPVTTNVVKWDSKGADSFYIAGVDLVQCRNSG